MKLVGGFLFIIASTYAGFELSHRYSSRTKQIREFIFSIQIIEAEMVYSYHSLQTICLEVAKKTTKPISTFYNNIGQSLTENITHFIELWNKEIIKLKEQSNLKDADIQIIEQFGQSLGQHNIEQQQKQITLTSHYLQQQLDQSIRIEHKYNKTFKSLGLLFGILIVLILM